MPLSEKGENPFCFIACERGFTAHLGIKCFVRARKQIFLQQKTWILILFFVSIQNQNSNLVKITDKHTFKKCLSVTVSIKTQSYKDCKQALFLKIVFRLKKPKLSMIKIKERSKWKKLFLLYLVLWLNLIKNVY
jgi:hypothetical protein